MQTSTTSQTRIAALNPEPIVVLENAFTQPFNNAIATARTCYSSRVIHASDMDKDEKERVRRDAIAASTYQAGHHTTLQHATFQFVLERVSRQFIWSFLHAHPYYNSEQVSQRYVAVKPGNYATPPMDEACTAIFKATVQMQMDAYAKLISLVEPTTHEEYFGIFKARAKTPDKWSNVLKKKEQEVARYVLPVATHAHLYHTISGITLHRYHRLSRQFDTPLEQKIVVDKMVEEVNKFDPLFFRNIEETMPLEQTVEYQQFTAFQDTGKQQPDSFVAEFDAELGGLSSKLIDYKLHAEVVLAQSVRSVLGITRESLSDKDAIDMVLNPAKNKYFGESLNLGSLSKLTRTLVHAHYTFKKKISHTADSQDQRHRMTPASRPILQGHFSPRRVDAIAPVVIEQTPLAKEFFWETMEKTWNGIRQLLDRGVAAEYALYLLPNAFPVRFEESGDLLNFHHKWTSRLCYTAQEEIWKNCWEEVQQIKKIHPLIADHLTAPCGLRIKAGIKPYCPEGDRFCGVPVWSLAVEKYQRVI